MGSLSISTPSTINSTSSSSSSIEANEMIELIRIYTTDDPRLHLRQYYYLKELKVPRNRLVKINCNFFNPESKKYYCFSYVSMYKINSSISTWTQPECKLTLNGQNIDPNKSPADLSTNHQNNLITNANISTLNYDNNNTNPSKDYQFAIVSPHGPSFTFTSTTHETSTDHKKSDLKKLSSSSPLALKLIKCRCNRLITYQHNQPNGNNSNQFNDQFLLELFPCSQLTDPLCVSINSSSGRSSTPLDLEPLCLLNLTQSAIKIQLQIVKSLSCDTINTNHQQSSPSINNQGSQLTPIIRDGLFSIDPQLEVNSESIVTHQLTSSTLRIELTNNQYYLIHINLINQHTSSSLINGNTQTIKHLFTSLIVFFSSFELIWLSLISLTSFIIISIIIFLCVYLIVPIRRRQLKVQMVLLDDLANTSTSFVDASSLEQFDFDESGSLEMDYYDLGMRSTRNNSMDKLSDKFSEKSINSVIK